jgi:hypothetical protein
LAIAWVKVRKWLQVWKKQATRGGRAGHGGGHEAGDMMKAENATFGISFCGSGGASAITAQTKYGYKANTACVPWMKASPPSTKAATCWASALWIKKSWASVWCRRGKEIRRISMKEQFTTTVSEGKATQSARLCRRAQPRSGRGDESLTAYLTAY